MLRGGMERKFVCVDDGDQIIEQRWCLGTGQCRGYRFEKITFESSPFLRSVFSFAARPIVEGSC